MLCLILFLALFATLSCSKEPPPTSSPLDNTPSSPDNPSSPPPDDPSSSSSPVSPPSPEVVIPDAALRTLIEKSLKKNPGATITQAGMNTLENLDGRELGIKSLNGLETATDLQRLFLDSNEISDLTPLAYLTQLQELSLNSNEISDLTPLAYRQLRIIDGLETGTNLQVLELDSNKISDLTPLAVLDSLQGLFLNSNKISDLTPLAYLDKLIHLELNSNEISDLTPLAHLDELKRLYVDDNPLSAASLLVHIPALRSNGIGVFFSPPSLGEFLSSFHPLDRESPFNIDLVFLDDFTAEEREMWHHMANFWESVIQTELPDYRFSDTQSITCGDHSLRISTDELIDDLRIYITKFDKIDPRGRQVGGYGGARHLRRSSSMPVTGCIGIEQNISQVDDLWSIGRHEIGHVLGIGTHWDRSGMLRDLNADAHFAGPQAIVAFNQAGGTNYRGAKVPTELDGSHWHLSVLAGELMSPSGYNNILSAITLGALSDLGYSVDFSVADPYVLPPPTAAKPVADAVPFCSLKGMPAPVYVDD